MCHREYHDFRPRDPRFRLSARRDRPWFAGLRDQWDALTEAMLVVASDSVIEESGIRAQRMKRIAWLPFVTAAIVGGGVLLSLRAPRQLAANGLPYQLLNAFLLRDDIRGEIKTRIQQRDAYSIQLIVGLGVIFGAAFAQHGLERVLVAAPLLAMYFAMLILYSYRIHDVLVRYLRDEVEPFIAKVVTATTVATDESARWTEHLEWENWYASKGRLRPGLRRRFFYWVAWLTTVGALAYLWVIERTDVTFQVVLAITTIAYLIALLVLTRVFWPELKPLSRSTIPAPPSS